MQKHLSLKHWRISAIVVLAALALIASASQAFAQGQSGESDYYTPKQVQGIGAYKFQTGNNLAEARNNGIIMDAWQGDDTTGQVWMSYNNGAPFTIGTTETLADPAVVAYGASGTFMVFHTGVDGNIYYTYIFGPNSNSGEWFQVPGQTTPNTMSVSVAQIGLNANYVYMVYRGSGNDTTVYGTWLGVMDSAGWSTPTSISGGLTVVSPAICLNNSASSLWVAAVGLDNQIWTTRQGIGAASWQNWTPQGVYTGPNNVDRGGAIEAPSCAATDNGNVMVDYVNTNGHPIYGLFNSGGGLVRGWTEDLVSAEQGWETLNTVHLTSAGNTVWSLFTGYKSSCQGDAQSIGKCAPTAAGSNLIYWKTLYVVP